MQLIPAKTPGFVKTLFPTFVWNINTDKKEVYLTFDDGPTPEVTDWVLQLLLQYNAKATFFCIGNNIKKHPDIFKNITDGNHTIGNHTTNHLKGWKHKNTDYLKDIEQTQKLIASHSPMLFRPPYGKFKVKQSKQLQKLGYKIIMWDVLSYDWDQSVSEEACFNNVISATRKGSIIVFHDSVKAFRNLKYVLPKILAYYSAKGYRFKAL